MITIKQNKTIIGGFNGHTCHFSQIKHTVLLPITRGYAISNRVNATAINAVAFTPKNIGNI